MSDNAAPVLALAGRLVDAAGAAETRFPLRSAPRVRAELAALLRARRPALLVSSAACGADLLAQDAARELGIAPLIVLPHTKEKFRAESVNTRPGDWGALYDAAVADAERRGALVIVQPPEGESPYRAATREIIRRAHDAAARRGAPFLAVAAWEGTPRSGSDHTAEFLRLAGEAGAEVLPHIDTR